jgi:hypothetical protein
MGNVGDLVVVGHPPRIIDFPVFGLTVVVSDEESCMFILRVIGPLFVVFQGDGHVVGLAFDDDQGVFLPLFGFGRAPDQKVGARLCGASSCDRRLLTKLIQRITIFVDQDEEEFLSDPFLRC